MTYIPSAPAPLTAFGDSLVSGFSPRVSLKATYGILDAAETFTATGGSATAASGEFVCQTGVSVGGYGVLWSRRPVVYYPGAGAEARLTARFTPGIASSLQVCGFFSATDGMFFGYNGTDFGVMHRRGGAFESQLVTVVTASTTSQTVTVTLNSIAYTAPVTNATKAINAHEIAAGLLAGPAAALWHIQHIGETVALQSKGAIAAARVESGTYSITVSGGTFVGTIVRITAGITPIETWINQTSWNGDTCSWLDTTKGNEYRLEYAYGYGPLEFYIMNPATSLFVLAHTIRWGNANTTVSYGNPSLRTGWVSASLGSSGTNLTVAGGSAAGAIQNSTEAGRPFGAFGMAAGVTTESQVLTIESRRVFGARSNNCLIQPVFLSLSTDSTKGAVFRLLLNPTIGGFDTPAYVDETQSCALYDAAGTTVTGGRLLGVYSIGPSGRAIIDLLLVDNLLVAGDQLVVSAQVVSGPASDMTAALTWNERV